MAILSFPTRNSFAQPRSHGSLAHDTQFQASRIAQQVEQELARQAQRMATGNHASRVTARLLTMPAPLSATAVRKQGMLAWFLTTRTAAVALIAGLFSL